MALNNKIILLIPYFGAWPQYIQIYNETCRQNSDILDIIFISDIPPFENASQNIRFIDISFDQLKKKIEKLFNIDIPNHKPYKLCDFRPAFGIIFNDLFKDYEFWGYTDCDLIYGDLSKFLTEEVLKNDIIAFRNNHLHGPFTLYKNTEKINTLFRKSPYYIDIFQDENYRTFDEFGSQGFHTRNDDISTFYDDTISIIAIKEAKKGNVKLYMQTKCIEKISESNDIVKYDNGEIINYKTGEEYAFCHWVIEKRALYFKYPKWEIVPKIYYVSSTGFYSSNQFKYYSVVNSIRKMTGIIKWFFLRVRNYFVRRTKGTIYVDTYSKPGFVKK